MLDRLPLAQRSQALGVHVRWAIRSDLNLIMAVERASFAAPYWSLRDYLALWRDRSTVFLVAEHEVSIVGFLIYRLAHPGVQLLNLAVRPELRRRGIGSLLLAHSLRFDRDHLTAIVAEENLEAQLFFRSVGFRAIEIIPDHAPCGDGYVMCRSI